MPDPEWQPLAGGRLARVLVATALYRPGDATRCLARVRVSNLSPKRIGVDLTDYGNVIFPNQWTVSPEPRRRVVDETEPIARPLSREDRRRLLERYRSDALVPIEPRASEDYLREFNGRCPTGSELPRDYYLIVSMTGRLWVTDGERVEGLRLTGRGPEVRDVVIPHPMAWRHAPVDVRVIEHPAGR